MCATTCGPCASRSSRSSPRCGSSAAPRRKAPSCCSDSSLLLTAPAAADDQVVRLLVLAPRALAERRDAPRRHGMAAALGLALAPAVRVVDRVHRRASHRRPLALPARAPRLPGGHVLVVDVPDLSHGRAALEGNAAHLARRETEDAVALVLGDELNARAGAPRHLPALPRLQLDVVDECPCRNVLERERIAGLDVGPWSRFDRRAHS